MKKILICYLLLTSLSFFAQDLNKVTIEELKATKSTIDTAAVAETIFSTANTSFFYHDDIGYVATTEMSFKIKIFKKEGFKYGTVTVPYFNQRTKSENVSISNAYTYNLVDGKIEKTKLKSSEEFTLKEDENWKTKNFVLSNVKEGSIIEYKIKFTTPFISNLNTWNFQQDIPVIYSNYRLRAPEDLKFQHFIKGFESVLVNKNNDYSDYTAKNLKPLKNEAFVNNIENYRTSLRLELYGYINNYGILEVFSDTWESLVKKIYDGDFGKELNRTRYFGNDLQNIIKDKNNRDEKMEAIFNYVQTNFKWNENRGYNTDLGVREAYKQKTGNVADINLILIAMLREAGLNANPILLSTRDNEVALYPSHSAFNYVIAGVEIQDDIIFLDATSKNARPNLLPIRALNWVGRIIRESGSSAQVELIPNIVSKQSEINTFDLKSDGSVSGVKRTRYDNYLAFSNRDKYSLYNNENVIKSIKSNYENIEIDNLEIKNLNDLNKDLELSYNFKLNNVADVIGNQIFFEPSFIFNLKKNPFLDENRKFPVDFVFPYKESISYIINIPEGFEVEYLPKSVQIKTQSNKFVLKWILSADKNKIMLKMNEDIAYPIFLADEYVELKQAFNEYAKIQNEKIILKKI